MSLWQQYKHESKILVPLECYSETCIYSPWPCSSVLLVLKAVGILCHSISGTFPVDLHGLCHQGEHP